MEQLAKPESMTAEQKKVFERAETIATENLRRRGGAASVLIASFRSDSTLEGKTLEQIAAARKQPAVRVALEMIAQGCPVDRVVQHVGGGHRPPHAAAIHDDVE